MKKKSVVVGLGVDVYQDNFEKAFRTFRKKVQKSGLLEEVRERRYYTKPNEVKRLAKKAAKRNNYKNAGGQPKRMF